jgi:hypothetical protein
MLAGSFSRSHSGGAATVTSRFKDFSNLLWGLLHNILTQSYSCLMCSPHSSLSHGNSSPPPRRNTGVPQRFHVIFQAVWPVHIALFRSQTLPYLGTKLPVILGCFCNSLFLHSFILIGIFHCLSLLLSPLGPFPKYIYNLSPLLPSLSIQPTYFRAQLRYYFLCSP